MPGTVPCTEDRAVNKVDANSCPLMDGSPLGEVTGHWRSLCIMRFLELCPLGQSVGKRTALRQDVG